MGRKQQSHCWILRTTIQRKEVEKTRRTLEHDDLPICLYIKFPNVSFLYSAGPTVLGRRYRQSCPLWPSKKNPAETCNYSNKTTPKGSSGRGWERVRQKKKAKGRGRETGGGKRRRGKVNDNRKIDSFFSFCVFAISVYRAINERFKYARGYFLSL